MTYSGWNNGETDAPVGRHGGQSVPPSSIASSGAASDLTGELVAPQFDSGVGASSATFWRGDLAWSDPATTLVTAGETLGGHRCVYGAVDGKAYYADHTAAPARSLLGVTTGASALNASATIQTGGVLVNVSWSWSGTDPVWLSTNGLLTQTPPASGYLVQVGVPVGPTKLLVAPRFIAFIGG